jgi:hypothetical protein
MLHGKKNLCKPWYAWLVENEALDFYDILLDFYEVALDFYDILLDFYEVALDFYE